MTKADLSRKIVEISSTGVTQAQAENMVNCFMDIVKDEVYDGGSVQLVGFGTFTSTVHAARECRNPSNGQKMQVPEKRVPKFIPGKAFKDALN